MAIALGSKLLGDGGSYFSSFQAKKSLPLSNTRRRLVMDPKSDPDTAMLQIELLDTLLKHSDNFKIFCADFEQVRVERRDFPCNVQLPSAAQHSEASVSSLRSYRLSIGCSSNMLPSTQKLPHP